MNRPRPIACTCGDEPRAATVCMWLILVLGLGLLLRTWGLSSEQPWWDEYLALRSLGEPSFSAYYHASREFLPATCPPLFVCLYGMARMGFDDPLCFRMLAVVLGMVSLALLFLIGRKALGARGGLLAMALCSVHFWLVYYSQEIREYPWVILLTILSSLCYLSMIEHPHRRLPMAGCALLNACLLVTHLMTVCFVLAQLAHWVLFALCVGQRGDRVRLLLWHVPGFVLWGSLCMAVDTARMAGSSGWALSLEHGAVPFLLSLIELAGGRATHAQFGLFVFPWSILFNGVIAAGVIVGAFAAFRVGFRNGTGPNACPSRFVLTYLAVWALIPPALLYGISWFVKPCFMVRYVAGSAPAFVLLTALALTQIRMTGLRTTAFAVTFASFLCVSLAHPIPLRPDFAEAFAFVAAVAHPGEDVATSSAPLARMMSYSADLRKACEFAGLRNRPPIRFAQGTTWQAPRIYVDNGTSSRLRATEKALRSTGRTFRRYSFPRPFPLSPLVDSSHVSVLTVYVMQEP